MTNSSKDRHTDTQTLEVWYFCLTIFSKNFHHHESSYLVFLYLHLFTRRVRLFSRRGSPTSPQASHSVLLPSSWQKVKCGWQKIDYGCACSARRTGWRVVEVTSRQQYWCSHDCHSTNAEGQQEDDVRPNLVSFLTSAAPRPTWEPFSPSKLFFYFFFFDSLSWISLFQSDRNRNRGR